MASYSSGNRRQIEVFEGARWITVMFKSFFMGGFECSTHRPRPETRLDLINATSHDRFVLEDYERLRGEGIFTAREGIRWHLIEVSPYQYDFSSVLPMLRAARIADIQVIWDVFHYGWPDDLDIFSPEFVQRFVSFSRAFIQLLCDETDEAPFICPINEISFFSWASGHAGAFHPFSTGRAAELKQQLVRAAIQSIETTLEVCPRARIVQIDPAINVIPDPAMPELAAEAEAFRLSQYESWDMLSGRLMPELGGHERYLDIIGVNYYAHNQWLFPDRTMIPRSDPLYRPMREILCEVYNRYRRPLFIAETGIEDNARPAWLRYVCNEVRAAMAEGAVIEGICLYPIVNHPGWVDDRHCHNGLWDYANEKGEREIYRPLARELRRQRKVFEPEIASLNRSSLSPSHRLSSVKNGAGTAMSLQEPHVLLRTGPLDGHRDISGVILVAEDSDRTRLELKEWLAANGYHALEALDGHQTLETITRDVPDLIIMDLTLPNPDTFDLIRSIRANTDLCGIPIIAISENGTMHIRADAAVAGWAWSVARPFDPQHIRSLVEHLMSAQVLQDSRNR